ncbi:nuclease-related domain-containing protein [Lysinibacillus telephonicus]|uniref:nuclease-related domain-containing protein n=1 Tax=Lysinibacillus telephonicus TaxID=1714840 RepID=UPI0016398531|nr:nuclease-related domain-containing protein [Lysinibacillus telephonicus]
MIILAREKPKKLEVLEAILRRLPDNDPNYDYYNDIYFRTKSGYDGEQKVDKEWSQINTHKSHYLLHNLELQNHQIDTLYICPNFLLILEIKNISGHLDFEYEKHQFLRTRNDGSKEGFYNPIDQVLRHARYLQSFNLKIPIEYAIVISNSSTIIGNTPGNIPIFHASGIHQHIELLTKKYSNYNISPKRLNETVELLIKHHNPRIWRFELETDKLLRGMICDNCNHKQPMKYYHGNWICNNCGKKGKEVLFTGLKDYRLLIDNKIRNKEFRTFFNIPSQDIAARILTRLNLPFEGNKKGRVYTIPPDFTNESIKENGNNVKEIVRINI